MGISTTVDHDRRRVLARAEGVITLEDVRAHLEEERLARGLPYSEIIDARGYSPAFSSAEVRDIVSMLRRLAEHTPLGPTAVVVDNDLGYAMLRMLEMLVEDVCDIRPFRLMEDAERWLAAVRGTSR